MGLNQTADRVASRRRLQLDPVSGKVENRNVTAGNDATISKPAGLVKSVVLVPYLTDDLLDNVLDGDDALQLPILAHHGAYRGVSLLHLRQKDVERNGARHYLNRMPVALDRGTAVSVENRLGELTAVHNP